MPGQEIRAEFCALALESSPGVAAAQPTIIFPFRGLLTPDEDYDEQDESTGNYEALADSTVAYRASMLDGDGPADTRIFPFLMAMTMDGSITPTTPSGGTLSRLWQATPTTTGNNQKTATLWSGDPNVAIFKAPYGICTGWEIATSEGRTAGTSLKASFFAQPMATATGVTVPAKALATKMRPLHMEAWLDNLTQGGTIGTTSVLGRIISATHTLELEREAKQLPAGPSASLSYTAIGRGTQQMNTKVKFHFTDNLTIYNQWEADDRVALRVRHNGPVIETSGGTKRHYIEIDNYGKWRDFGWAEFATTNRAFEVTLRGLLHTPIGASFAARCQTTLTSLS
jgi:hypothetical protein